MQKPEETSKPEETQKPKETQKPEETPKPEEIQKSQEATGINVAYHTQDEIRERMKNDGISKSDADNSNIDRVGHRRWVLNPRMAGVGFGMVNGGKGSYSAMYSFDSSAARGEYGVAWPAQNTPIAYFNNKYPWSVSMGYAVDQDAVKVTLTRTSDGKVWNFSGKSADGAFYVNNDNYGQSGCIIFRPDDVSYSAGDSFQVTIEGLKEPVSYIVNFFD